MRNNFNPWHQVVPQTENADVVKGIIEIPKGDRAKYELDKESGLLRLDRVLYSSMYYPHNYGFIPQSYCDDHEPFVACLARRDDPVGELDRGRIEARIAAFAAARPA